MPFLTEPGGGPGISHIDPWYDLRIHLCVDFHTSLQIDFGPSYEAHFVLGPK